MRVLGIESSCDETAVAVYDAELRPAVASACTARSRCTKPTGAWCRNWPPGTMCAGCCPWSGRPWPRPSRIAESIDGVAYTAGPGPDRRTCWSARALPPALGSAWGKPALGIHHLEGHLLAPLLEPNPPAFPFLALLVSGGHTQLVDVAALGEYRILGETLDDAAGEAFDKTAKLLGLPYPGGAALAKLARAAAAAIASCSRGPCWIGRASISVSVA